MIGYNLNIYYMVEFKELSGFNLDKKIQVRKLRDKNKYRVSRRSDGKILLSSGSKKETINFVKQMSKNKGNAIQENRT